MIQLLIQIVMNAPICIVINELPLTTIYMQNSYVKKILFFFGCLGSESSYK